MFLPLSLAVFLSATVVLMWSIAFVVRDRPVVLKQLWAAAVVECLLAVQAVSAAVALVAVGREIVVWEYWGYVFTALLVLPAAAAWAFAERTKWSSVVLAVAAFTVIFLQWRLLQLWG
ncbi:hypothetical protein [Jonesia quinghaiensis]|uniref:hypothetical protein n=1 Tax=Jonesia quinghaiensis TaxID=262806 RepID=UPI000408764B|nr:hypothetical protein [Jonesia quinghaiensis]